MSSYEPCSPERLSQLHTLELHQGAANVIATYSNHQQQACDGDLQEAEAAKEVAEQRFWLPLERSKGRQMGELCVSLLFTKVCAILELAVY